MRLTSFARAVALTAALTAPLVHAARADAPQAQTSASISSGGNADAPMNVGGPYDNDSVMAPPVGD